MSSYQVYSKGFDSSVEDLKKDLVESKKGMLKNKVNNLSELIVYEQSKIKEELVNRVKGRVKTAYAITNKLYYEYKDTKSENEIKDLITTTLKTFIWNEGESYIWVMDYFGVHYLLENEKILDGASFIDFQDAKGRYVVQEEVSICKEKGEGFLWDTFTKPNQNSNTQYEQVAFVKTFEPYNLCIGSAEFLDTATKKTNKLLFDMVRHVDKIGHNYVAIINNKGNLLVHNKLIQFVGEDVEITDKLVVKTIKELSEAIKNKEHTSYVHLWRNPSSDKIEERYAYLKRIPHTDWFITSGFFLSDVENQLAKQKVNMLEIYNANTKNTFFLAVLIIFISLVISFFISQKIRKRFSIYQLSLGEKNRELHELNITLEEKVKIRTAELSQIKDDFEKLATTDALTRIHNRYSIMNILSKEISRSNRYDSPLSILMYDIDHFKAVNDTYGHDIGDQVLVSLSKLVSESIRDIDYLGRYGGEEFLIIMPNTLLQNATIYAHRLRQTVEENNFKEVGQLTISIGVVELQDDENIDVMFKRVDDLLYESKNSGRNRVSS